MLGKPTIIARTTPHDNRSNWGDFFAQKTGKLILQDGTTFMGKLPKGQKGVCTGEVVFNTGMTGYVESLTDPSYAGQILVFTYPLIGNYGVDPRVTESGRIQASGVIVSEAAVGWSHAGADRSLLEWLSSQGVPILIGVDTRALTKHLRVDGTVMGAMGADPVRPRTARVVPRVISVDRPVIHNESGVRKVILVDCGMKQNILRSLLALNIQVKQVPHDYDYTKEEYDGVLLSNGPGDPTNYLTTIATTRRALAKNKPIFGICLGSQIMGLAAGASTYKLKFGHRGHNQPCLENGTDRGYITSQNHSYAIDASSLPKQWRVLFKNLNDGSVEGIQHITKPFFAVQFHPEACPGPTDSRDLFERFYKSL